MENKFYAKKYYELGFNVTCISTELNDFNFYSYNLLKAPNHEWKGFFKLRQNEQEFNSLNFTNSAGLGTVTGFNNLLVLDFDGCTNYDMIRDTLSILGLPVNYEWVIQSGSGIGFHIFVECLKPSYLDEKCVVAKYPANNKYKNDIDAIEFLWKTHVVLPPSIHQSTRKYNFLNTRFPRNKPQLIEDIKLELIISKYFNSSKKILSRGYNPIRRGHVQNAEVIEKNGKFYYKKAEKYGKTMELNKFELVDRGDEGKAPIFHFPVESKIEVDENLPLTYNKNYSLIFDIETDGLINEGNYPNILQIAWIVLGESGEVIRKRSFLIGNAQTKETESFKINKLDIEVIRKAGKTYTEVLNYFLTDVECCGLISAHNLEFDLSIVNYHITNQNLRKIPKNIKKTCTMKSSVDFCKIKNNFGYKFPKLDELYYALFGVKINQLHNAEYDTLITSRCFRHLFELGYIN